MITLQSTKGGRPLRTNSVTRIFNRFPNIKLEKKVEVSRTGDYYCLKIGFLKDGDAALIRFSDAEKLYKILDEHFKKYS